MTLIAASFVTQVLFSITGTQRPHFQTVPVVDIATTATPMTLAVKVDVLNCVGAGIYIPPFAFPKSIDIVSDPSIAISIVAHKRTLLDAIDPLADQVLAALFLHKVALAVRLAILQAPGVIAMIFVFCFDPLNGAGCYVLHIY